MLIFVHIPKAAGNSLNSTIAPLVGHHRNCVSNDQNSFAEAAKKWPRDKPLEIAYLAGHICLPVIEQVLSEFTLRRPKMIFTILREPIARAYSYYLFVQRTPAMARFRAPVEGKDFDYFWDYFIENVYWTLRDPQCFLLCGKRSAALAKQTIQDRNILVGTVDTFDRLYAELRERVDFLPLPKTIARTNVAPSGSDASKGAKSDDWREAIRPETIRKIEQQNAADCELWEYVSKERDGLIPWP